MSISQTPAGPATLGDQIGPGNPASAEVQTLTVQQPDRFQLRDLVAQEDMAFWAMWMFFAAIATFVITSLGTLLIWRQVRLTREAVQETATGTNAMQEANAIAREMGEAQARCYLSAKDVSFSIDQHGIPCINLSVLNSGQSPARNFRWAFQVRLANITDDWAWENQPMQPGGGIDIAAQQQEPLSLGIIDGNPLPQDKLSDLLLSPETRITVKVFAEWSDVFQSEWDGNWPFQANGPCGVDDEIKLFPDFLSAS